MDSSLFVSSIFSFQSSKGGRSLLYSGNNHSSHSTSLQVTCIYSSDCTKNQLSASSMIIMCLMVYNVYLYVSVLCDWVFVFISLIE